MMTKEEKNRKRRAWYAKNKDRINADRRKKYAIATKFTKTSKEARDYRGYSVKHIQEKLPDVGYREDERVFFIRKKKVLETKPLTEKELKRKERTRRRRVARDLGYTPEEADYLRDVAEDKWNEIISQKKIVDPRGRIERWVKMSDESNRRNKFDTKIEEACQAINLEAGYDINSRYGYAVYYFWYIYGGDIEGWKGFVEADPFNSSILAYGKENVFAF